MKHAVFSVKKAYSCDVLVVGGGVAGIAAARMLRERPAVDFPNNTAIGALAHYISNESIADFQPMNVNFGIFSQDKITAKKKKDRRAMMSQLAQEEIKDIAAQIFAAEKD